VVSINDKGDKIRRRLNRIRIIEIEFKLVFNKIIELI
jgi:hypothetical protein